MSTGGREGGRVGGRGGSRVESSEQGEGVSERRREQEEGDGCRKRGSDQENESGKREFKSIGCRYCIELQHLKLTRSIPVYSTGTA